MKASTGTLLVVMFVASHAFSGANVLSRCRRASHGVNRLYMSNDKDNSNSDLSSLLTARLPTSVEDQVRQAAESLKRATADGFYRHSIRLLLPLSGATELDDWPGGARQQMEAACPLMENILKSSTGSETTTIQKMIIDVSDGVAALMTQAPLAKDDSCTVLLPTAETVQQSVLGLDDQVGANRNLILVNPQYRRRSDFGGFFGANDSTIADYVEQFVPTFALTNLICEGESVRILRTHPGPWRVFVREEDKATGTIDWKQVGSKDVLNKKPKDWQQQAANQRDGGTLFNYGQPTYQEIIDMLYSSPKFTPKSPAERAAAAFNFIKDTL
jgi:Domain of unknown function (DUF1995)